MKLLYFLIALSMIFILSACVNPGGPVVHVTSLEDNTDLDPEYMKKLAEIKKEREKKTVEASLSRVIEATPNLSVHKYLELYPEMKMCEAQDYKVGGGDVLSITVYGEEDLSRENVPISAKGYISFPLLGRLKIINLSTTEIEKLISLKLAEKEILLDAHVSLRVAEYNSKKFMVFGSVKEPGTYPLQARERIMDAISKAKGIDSKQGGKQAMIIRTENPNTDFEKNIVIKIDLAGLLKGSDQVSNILLLDRDRLYLPKAEHFYIIGQVKKPGSYLYLQKEVTLVEAISMAGGFTAIAARNRTRIIRMENGVEKIIVVKVNEITGSGKKTQDVKIKPEDVIVVPESFF
ncbi:polysaccharide biosynthesis/export protein [Candidatus Magnetomoraceae bacterium gMMP-1]